MSKIVVGYDGSDCGEAALDEACRLAKELGDEIVVVFGYAPGGYGGGEIPTHREAVEELGEKVDRRGAAASTGSRHRARGEAAAAEARPRAGRGGAEDVGARMIVVGSYGEAPLKGRDPRLDPIQASAHLETTCSRCSD